MANYFEGNLFVDELDYYPIIIWPHLGIILNEELDQHTPLPPPKAPLPPGCFSFGYEKEYKKLHEAYLKEKAEYEYTEEENGLMFEHLLRLKMFPASFPKEHPWLIESLLRKKIETISTAQTKRGYAEVSFLNYLQKYFPGEIQTGIGIPCDFITNPYLTPDFVFSNSTSNLKIAIEIDEPYTLESREPIHYRYVKKENLREEIISVDSYRNISFTLKGWFVLRFSEEQVIKQPDECCHFIADLVEAITGDKKYKKFFSKIKYPNPKNSWTLKHVIELHEKSYRENYLCLPKESVDINLNREHLKQLEALNQFLSYSFLKEKVTLDKKALKLYKSLH